MKKPSFAVVWRRIVEHEGQTFFTKIALPFTFRVSGNTLTPAHVNRNIPKKDIQDAYSKVPFAGPGILAPKKYQGRAYIWGILHDPRISGVFALLDAHTTSKYYPLELFLKCVAGAPKHVTLSFQQIDLILRLALPTSAFINRIWWGNDRSHVQAKSWMNAGFEVDAGGVDLDQGWVRFKRVP